MSTINNVGKKISQTGQNFVQKTKNVTESIKINSLITDEKKKIDNFYLQIGKKYYEIHKQTYEEQFETMIKEIDNAEKNIKEFECQLNVLKGVAICPNCGSELLSDSLFCYSCGARVDSLSTNNEENNISGNICNKCGAIIAPDKTFCTNCGNKIAPPESQAEKHYPSVEQSVQINTIKCAICGKEISAEAEFCSGCGNKVVKEQGNNPVQTDQSNLSNNSESVVRCPKCNKILSNTAVFCSGCGEKVKGA